MKLTSLEADLAIHQKLEDEPNDVGGMTAQALKAKFDEAGLVIQDYLNGTHLPEVEEALAENLEAARLYADRKVAAVGAGDMAKAIYDREDRGVDLYQYAHEEAQRVLGGAARFGYVALGQASGTANTNEENRAALTQYADPRGMWLPERQGFLVPEGARWMAFTVGVKWAREHFADCAVEVFVNNVKQSEVRGPEINDGSYYFDTVVVPAEVKGGDLVSVWLWTRATAGFRAYAAARWLRAEVLL